MPNKELLAIIADNENLLEVLKQLLLDEFEVETPQADLGVEDVVLGQILRARLVGKKKIDDAFRKILTYKTVIEEPEKINMAR